MHTTIIEADAATRKLERPLEELLQTGKLGISAAATVRGQLSLLKWAATGELEHLQQATDLLKSAAKNGDPEACYFLARYQPRQLACVWGGHVSETEVAGDSLYGDAPDFLIEDEAERKNFLHRARKAGYVGEWDDRQYQDLQEDLAKDAQRDREAMFREDSINDRNREYKVCEANISRLKSIPVRTDAQELVLAKLLQNKKWFDFIDHGAEKDESLALETQICIEKASSTMPEARYLHAEWAVDLPEDMRLDLYRRAAYPEAGATAYIPAFAKLASFYADEGKSFFNLDLAEKTLRDRLLLADQKKTEGEVARYELAEFLRKHRDSNSNKQREALDIYRALSDESAWCAFNAALVLVKLNHDGKDLEEAKELLRLAQKGKQAWFLGGNEFPQVSIYAEIAYKLGWSGSVSGIESIVDILMELLERNDFSGEPECPITPEIAFVLMLSNAGLAKNMEHIDSIVRILRGSSGLVGQPVEELLNKHHEIGVYGTHPASLICGLIAILHPGTFNAGNLAEYFDDNAMVSEYVMGRLMVANRLGGSKRDEAICRFQRAIQIGEKQARVDIEPSYYDERIQQRILDNSKREERRLIEEKQRADVAQAEESAKKDMLSFLSHALTNSVAFSAESLRRIARSLTSLDAGDPAKRRRAAEQLAGMVASFSLTESLVDAFKLYASDPKALQAAWENDLSGEVSLKRVIALAMRQSLSRFFVSAEHIRDFKRLLPGENYADLSQQFIESAMVFDLDHDEEVEQLFSWINSILPIISLNINGGDEIHISRGGARYVVIFSIISECLTNALKYSNGNQAIGLNCTVANGYLKILCANPFDPQSSNTSRGGRKGLAFMQELSRLIGAQFEEPETANGEYRVNVHIPM